MATKLFIGSLSHQADNHDLEAAFKPYGEVLSATVIFDRDTQRSKGFGFVEMSTAAEAKSAIQALDGKEILGRPVVVNEARPRDDKRPQRSGGGGGRNNRY